MLHAALRLPRLSTHQSTHLSNLPCTPPCLPSPTPSERRPPRNVSCFRASDAARSAAFHTPIDKAHPHIPSPHPLLPPQSDVLPETSTVFEHLMLHAALRLPRLSVDDRTAEAEHALAALGMAHKAHSAIGGDQVGSRTESGYPWPHCPSQILLRTSTPPTAWPRRSTRLPPSAWPTRPTLQSAATMKADLSSLSPRTTLKSLLPT